MTNEPTMTDFDKLREIEYGEPVRCEIISTWQPEDEQMTDDPDLSELRKKIDAELFLICAEPEPRRLAIDRILSLPEMEVLRLKGVNMMGNRRG